MRNFAPPLGLALVVVTACSASSGGSTPTPHPSSSISGTVAGARFDTVANAFYIGKADSADTTVVYLFGANTPCAAIAQPGWDHTIAEHTQALEIKIVGTSAGMYDVVKTPTPASGQATVSYTLSSASSPSEIVASGGSVTLRSITPGTSATGAFSVQFDADTLRGEFGADFCADGVEP